MATSHHKYTDGIVRHLGNILSAEAQKGTPKEYEIRVDGIKVVPRTSAIELFDSFTEFIHSDAATVTVLLFRGASQYSDKYVLSIGNNPMESQSLNGPEIEDRINHKLREAQREHELKGLKKENQKLRLKLKRKKKYISNLEDSLLEHQEKKFHLGDINLGELSSHVLEGIVRRNTHFLTALPGGQALAGAIEADNEQKAKALNAPAPEATASFQREEDDSPNLTTEQLTDLATGAQIRTAFPAESLPQVQDVLRLLAGRPKLIGSTIEYLISKTQKA